MHNIISRLFGWRQFLLDVLPSRVVLSYLGMAEHLIMLGDAEATRILNEAMLHDDRGILRVLPLGLNP